MERQKAVWTPADDEHTDTPHCWFWGDWAITLIDGEGYWLCVSSGVEYGGDWAITLIDGEGYWLCVSSGVEYGPFATWDAVTQHAENVRGD